MSTSTAKAAWWPNRKKWLLVGLLVVHADLAAWMAVRSSATIDEPGHLAAGLAIWELGRFDLYRVNPPLVKTVATAPVAVARPKSDWSRYRLGPSVRPEWSVGSSFVAANPRNWHWYLVLARWTVIPFSLLGGYVCYRWAGELYGQTAGLLALALWCFSPNVLAFAGTITADVSAAALGVLALYTFWKWLKEPAWPRVMLAGLALGLAELAKMTWIVLFPLFPLLWLGWRLGEAARRRRGSAENAGSRRPADSQRPGRCAAGLPGQAGQLAAVLLLALYVLNVGYAFEGSFQRLEEYTFVSRTLAGPDAVSEEGTGGNRFAEKWLGRIPVPLPENYLSGMDLQKLDFEKGKWSYLNGEWKQGGWWHWYLYALLLKVPLGTWVLLLTAAALTLWHPRRYFAGWRNELLLLVPAAAVFVLVSSQTGFSRYLRYMLPCFPFVFIGISKAARSIECRQWLIAAGGGAALLWSAGSSLWVYPHSISYFNELAGGPQGGHHCLIDSNIDWGQDLWYLKQWYDEHPEARPFFADVYSFVDLEHFGISAGRPIVERRHASPAAEHDRTRLSRLVAQPGWYAISVHRLHDRSGKYSLFLKELRPVATAGYSVYIYHVPLAKANRLRQDVGLPVLESDTGEKAALPAAPSSR